MARETFFSAVALPLTLLSGGNQCDTHEWTRLTIDSADSFWKRDFGYSQRHPPNVAALPLANAAHRALKAVVQGNQIIFCQS